MKRHMSLIKKTRAEIIWPVGQARGNHLWRYRGFAVANYSVTPSSLANESLGLVQHAVMLQSRSLFGKSVSR